MKKPGRPLTNDELHRLTIATGLSNKRLPYNFGKHATDILRLIGEVQRSRRDKAAKNAAELSETIDAARNPKPEGK